MCVVMWLWCGVVWCDVVVIMWWCAVMVARGNVVMQMVVLTWCDVIIMIIAICKLVIV